MKRILRRAVYFTMPATLVAACDSFEEVSFASYDDCILRTVSGAPNREAVEELRAACIRKFAVSRTEELDVSRASEDFDFTISNTSEFIVLNLVLETGDGLKWEVSGFLQPGEWEEMHIPSERDAFLKALAEGQVSAKTTRVIAK